MGTIEMLDYKPLDLEELKKLLEKGYRIKVEVMIEHNLEDFNRWEFRRALIGELGQLVSVEEDPNQEALLRGEWLPSFPGASKHKYSVDFGDITNDYNSSYLQDPGYVFDGFRNMNHSGHPAAGAMTGLIGALSSQARNPPRIEHFFKLYNKTPPENPNQLKLFDDN
jgi:hypothetical protein